MARKKPGDALKAKEKKQKIFVAIGLVALLGAGAYEVPMIMGGGEAAAPPPAATTAAPVTAAPQATPATGTPASLAPPTPGATPTPVTSAGIGQLVDTDLVPQATQTSLIGFSLFRSKDPFVQQIAQAATDPATISGSAADPNTGAAVATPASGDGSASGGAATGSDASSGSGSSSGTGSGSTSGTPGSFVPTTGSGSAGSSASGATQTGETVMVSVNGKQEAVGKGGTFPQSAPTFRVVGFGKGTAEIGIVGGSYAAGNQTVTLKQGVPLTLVNTLDDTRYRIVLVRTP